MNQDRSPAENRGPRALLAGIVALASRGVSGAILLREAARTSRRWQTYLARTAFSGVLLGVLLLGMWAAVGATTTVGDASNLGWLGRALFGGFAVTQILLALVIAPLTAASAVIEETDERTMDLLVLTSLTPGQILGAKLTSRILLLITVVFGALPVMAMVVNLGGVSGTEVVAATVHTLTTVVLMAALGGFFALFTRSPALAMMASASYSVPFFVLWPAMYVVCTGDVYDAARFSTFAASLAVDPSAWITPLSFLPSLVVVFGVMVPLFRLKIANADLRHAFSESVWRSGRWAMALATWIGLGLVTLPIALGFAWWFNVGDGKLGVLTWPVRIAVEGWIWSVFTFGAALGTWAFLRVGMDVVDGIDSVFSNQPVVPRTERTSGLVWSNPVIWREARPRAWMATSAPLLVTWGLLMLAVFQTGFWIVPGGLLGIGLLNALGGIVFSVWLAARTVGEERRRNTLEALLATTMRSPGIVAGKLAGVMLPTLPLIAVSLPLLGFGLWHLRLVYDPSAWDLVLGFATWAWLLPVWALAVVLAMIAATRLSRPENAFGVVTGGLGALYGLCAVLGHALPDQPLVAVPARILAPPLAGGFELWQIVLSTGLTFGVAGALLLWYVDRLRAWVGMSAVWLALLLAAGGSAEAAPAPDAAMLAELERVNALRMVARPLADGLVREDRFSSLLVRVENRGPGTVGTVSLAERTADGGSVTYRRRIELPEGAARDVVLLFRPGVGEPTRTLELSTRDGRIALAPFSLRAVSTHDVVVGVIGRDPLGLPAAIRASSPAGAPGRQPREVSSSPRTVWTGTAEPAALPRHFAGYGAIDWMVWPAADPSTLSVGQADALRYWVADGGHLLLSVTDTWRQVADSPLAEALPVSLTGIRDADVGALASALGLPGSGLAPVATTTPKDGVAAVVRARAPGGEPLWISASYGLGSVHLVLAELRGGPLALRGQEEPWRRLLALAPAREREDEASDDRLRYLGPAPAALERMLNLTEVAPWTSDTPWNNPTPESGWESEVRGRLSDIPGVTPLPLSWLAAFAAAYLLAIGPLDWLVLRTLRRQPLTWITFPALIVLFTGVSLAITSYTKGSQAVVVRVEVVDDLPGTGLQRGQTWLGVFSTRKTGLKLTSGYEGAVVTRPVVPGFQNAPVIEAGDGPGSLSYQAETWTLAYARSDWVAPAEGGIEVVPEGDRWVVRNGFPFPLDEVAIVVPSGDGYEVDGWARIGGPVAPGAAIEIPEAPARQRLEETGTATTLDWAVGTFAAGFPSERGTIRPESSRLVVAVAAQAREAISLEGLAPIEQPLMVVRHPFAGGPQLEWGSDLTPESVLAVQVDAGGVWPEVVCDGAYPAQTGAHPRLRFTGLRGEGCTMTMPGADPPVTWPVRGGERWTCRSDAATRYRCTRISP